MDRRTLLKSSLLVGAAFAGGRSGFAAGAASPYGPLASVQDEETGLPLLRLPDGFRYRSFGWEGDEMSDGTPTPDRHDGMGVIPSRSGRNDSFVLMRNHERALVPRLGTQQTPAYDRFALAPQVKGIGGGTTALIFENGRCAATVPTLSGTLVNCAGGTTPWGSWLTCEEIVVQGRDGGARDHGYVFEVPSPELGAASAVPIVAMGRMKHEAVAVDSQSGFVYLTEDNGPSGFYRFRPRDKTARLGALEQGGRLDMLKVRGRDNVDLGAPREGDVHDVEWVPVAEPDAAPARREVSAPNAPLQVGLGKSGPFLQGEALGAAAFRRLEGCFPHAGLVYFTDTTGGAARSGVVWALAPGDVDSRDVLRCVYVSAGQHEADRVDNLCVGPRGGIVMCEDGGGERGLLSLQRGNRLIGLGPGSLAFVFAENNMIIESRMPGRPWIAIGDFRDSEFAGACYAPRGDRMFVNVQTPGVTFEIFGPWERGPL